MREIDELVGVDDPARPEPEQMLAASCAADCSCTTGVRRMGPSDPGFLGEA
ncbi:hypothetical protein ACIA98_42265 [Streptomyces sp. NPDC051366]|uniref:hypothetical protein n=1 Tax=Streptomyces sp. NPDC051366 TaxID=3365652 RepID=UPI0037A7DE0B